ncbi:MAG: right-handed parallel beta-helix repeat-containing protein [Mucilaginibacter sp.]
MSLKFFLTYCVALALSMWCTMAFAQMRAKTYYVNARTGNDDNPGTIARPLRSLEKISSLQLKAGECVLFKGGQVFEGTLYLHNINGSVKNPIIITSYGRGKSILNARDSAGIILEKCTGITLRNLGLTGSGRKAGNTRNGLTVKHSNHIAADDLNISGFQKSGLLIYSSQYINAKNVFAHDNGSAGITVEAPYQTRESTHITISNCRAENNPGDPTNLTNHSGNGIVAGDCRNVLIDHCTATNNGWDMPRIGNGPVGIWAYEADSVMIQYCLSYQNKTSKGGADGGGFDFDGGVTNSIIQYCMSYGNQGSGYCIFQYWGADPWYNNIIRFNISENDGTVSDSQAGIYVWNVAESSKDFHDCDVYGNIIYNDKVSAFCWSKTSDSHGMRFYNNIFVGRDSLMRGRDKAGEAQYHDNDWWSINKGFYIDGFTNINSWAKQSGKEQRNGKMVGLNINPQFKKPGAARVTSAMQLKYFTNYQLPANSPLRSKPVYNGKYGVKNIKFD